MIGNDIVDLAQSRIESNWQRKGFLEKLFSIEEQRLINNYAEPETMVWLLWSMKEAAYKIYNRQTKIREFSPKKLSCFIDSLTSKNASGKVICDKNIYHTKAMLSAESIHTIAVDDLENINNVIEIQKQEIVKDENGIPHIKTENSLQAISISHHGRFQKWVTIS